MNTYVPDDPIAALATPLGRSALAVIRTTGTGCIELVSRLFSAPKRLKKAAGHTVLYGKLLAPAGSAAGSDAAPGAGSGRAAVDEVLLTVFRAPAAYTGQESVEISCHGSPAGVERVLALLYDGGFRPAQPGEFTMRAFLNGKLDLTRAEAVNELIDSQTKQAHELALHRLSGSVERAVNAVKSRLTKIMAAVEIQLDYPEEDTGEVPLPREAIEESISELSRLLESYATGRLYQEGARVALAGRTNAGKSSLFNRFVHEERAIVSETHGTTRDYLETRISVCGIPVRLFDTAGLRDASEAIESEGIRRSGVLIESADLVLYIVDSTVGLTDDDVARLEKLGLTGPHNGNGKRDPSAQGSDSGDTRETPDAVRVIALWNKWDRKERTDPPAELPVIAVSAETGHGFAELENAVLERLMPHGGEGDSAAVIDSVRQKQLLERCVDSLREVVSGLEQGMPVDAVALDLQDALQALGEITGEVTTADILDTMFQGFCVGK